MALKIVSTEDFLGNAIGQAKQKIISTAEFLAGSAKDWINDSPAAKTGRYIGEYLSGNAKPMRDLNNYLYEQQQKARQPQEETITTPEESTSGKINKQAENMAMIALGFMGGGMKNKIPNPKSLTPEAKTSHAQEGEFVQRYEEPNVPMATIEKPHGIYTTPANVESPHSELGGKKSLWKLNPKAKVLDLTQHEPIPMRDMSIDSGVGVHAAKKLLPKELSNEIGKNLTKKRAMEIAKERFPQTDFSRYYDGQEIVEAIGAMEAKKNGFDILKRDDLGDSRFSERVILTKNATIPTDIWNEAHKIQPSLKETLKKQEIK